MKSEHAFRICAFSILLIGLLIYASPAFTKSLTADKPKQEETKKTILLNPFTLAKNQIVPGTTFQVEVKDKTNIDLSKDDVKLTLRYDYIDVNERRSKTNVVYLQRHFKEDDKKNLIIEAEFPEYKDIKNIETQSTGGGIFFPYKGTVEILSVKSGVVAEPFLFPVRIPSVKWAYLWSIFIIVVSLLVLAILKPDIFSKVPGVDKDKDMRAEEWEKVSRVKRFFLYPLNFTVTPVGKYSISLTQILIWTFVTIFGLVYVYRLTGSFLDITTQVLMLLGIGGATAIGSKINAISKSYEVPAKYLNLVTRTRIPKLRDIISSDGQPNIYKFQMLVFTLLTAFIVITEIAKKYVFPAIPDNLIALMGISSSVYIGNEIAQENIWDKIKKNIDAIEKQAKDKTGESAATTEDIKNMNILEVDELKKLLESIYS